MLFENKNVVITGAGRSIGKRLALGFAEQGATILAHYSQSRQGAEEVQRQIEEKGGKVFLYQADLCKPEEAAQLVRYARQVLGLIDVWINNAGASANSAETRGMSEIEIFERMVGVDIMGTWRCCREVQPYMREGGSIITTGWDRALDGAPGLPNQMYAISKGAIMSLTRCLATEFAPHVRVNCIAPGRIENEWSQTLSEETRQQAVQDIPMKRWGTPDDILQTAIFLASAASSFMTGQTLLVNGGEIMR
ncbi:SDR family NAD(P)-dependent oxidoreductase [Dictyobacter aurantiacus]|uniref:3-oxoacyl-[acyl-carrier-protein] reductase FabG n=1 Tax=Dictyobacter aurantiacus TaxID=1936993 RepID=A0A401ZD93_9CHLR|nr:SDR family NAD(P)-dependent oxidoreductase [Dictyobacter aurantiacus]GCE04854.1 3-oxoacyl-[acyl-carrier-protein] reductase FabG [Dictyobacter aurantiacus]